MSCSGLAAAARRRVRPPLMPTDSTEMAGEIVATDIGVPEEPNVQYQ